MPVKSIILASNLTIDDLPDTGSVNSYLSYIQAQIFTMATNIKENKHAKGGIGVEIDFLVDYFLHDNRDYKNLSLNDIFNHFYKLCGVSCVFDFVNWLNETEGEQVEESVIVGILNKKIEFTERVAKLIINRIEEHIKIETALKRALYVHTSVGVKKGFDKDSFEDNFKISDYDKQSTELILYIRDKINKILHATESLKYQSLSFRYIIKFQYEKIER